jgi:hypothetical protein
MELTQEQVLQMIADIATIKEQVKGLGELQKTVKSHDDYINQQKGMIGIIGTVCGFLGAILGSVITKYIKIF